MPLRAPGRRTRPQRTAVVWGCLTSTYQALGHSPPRPLHAQLQRVGWGWAEGGLGWGALVEGGGGLMWGVTPSTRLPLESAPGLGGSLQHYSLLNKCVRGHRSHANAKFHKYLVPWPMERLLIQSRWEVNT